MNHNEICLTILHIRPNAEWSLSGDDLIWLDTKQNKPTKKEIESGWIAYQAEQIIKTETIASAKSALLDKLGINEDEAKLLLG